MSSIPSSPSFRSPFACPLACLSALALLALAACTSPLSLENLPCPCASGWQCCAGDNVCVKEGEACPAPSVDMASWQTSLKVTRNDAQANDGLGLHVAVSGGYAFASSGARGASGGPSSAVYAFEQRGASRWVRTQQLLFGAENITALAMDGDQALIATKTLNADQTQVVSAQVHVATHTPTGWSVTGAIPSLPTAAHCSAYLVDGRAMIVDGSGAVHILTSSGSSWTEEYSVTLDEAACTASSFTGDRALVMGSASMTSLSGGSHIYELGPSGWAEATITDPTSMAAPDSLGILGGLAGDTAVFTQRATDTYPQGAVHLYQRGTDGTWSYASELDPGLTSPESTIQNCFGPCSVVGDASSIILGTASIGDMPMLIVFNLQAGSWTMSTTVPQPSWPSPTSGLSFSGDVLAVGEDQSSAAAQGAGAIQLFTGLSTGTVVGTDPLTSDDELTGNYGDYDGSGRGGLGIAASASGETALLVDTGAGYIYGRVGTAWVPQAVLTLPDQPGVNAALAYGVLAGTSAVFAGIDGSNSGYAYLFNRNLDGSFAAAAPLIPTGLPEFQQLGYMLAADEGIVGIGSMHLSYSVPGTPDTFATLFEEGPKGWTQTALLETPDEEDRCRPQSLLAVSKTHVLLAGSCSTSFDHYARASDGSWVRQGSLSLPGSGWSALAAVTLRAERAAVAAYDENNVLATFIFDFAGGAWTQSARLVDTGAVGSVGSVALGEDLLAVGHVGAYPNSVYLYQLTGGAWTQLRQLAPTNASPNPGFGSALSFGTDFLLIGSPGDGISPQVAGGAVYVYQE
jgi:hypothetical protein